MPTVLRSGPYRFFFYAGDRTEPPHVHAERDDSEAKFWLDPVRLQRSYGFSAKELRRIEKSSTRLNNSYWNDGMNTSTVESQVPIAANVRIDADSLTVELTDGRTVSTPIAWYPRLSHGTPEERSQWRLVGGGRGVHWPKLDEDISVENILAGSPSGESQESFKKWLEQRTKK